VAVAALTEDGHAGALYELTGPRLLTFAEAVGEIARTSGRAIRYVPVSIEQHAAAAGACHRSSRSCSSTCSAGSWTAATPTWQMASSARGREPRDFADYARDAAVSGVWNAPAITR